jgi:hypothetical protein
VLSHERSYPLYAAAVLIAGALLTLTPRLGSPVVSLGSGLAAGGALATALCGIAWRDGVPNPLAHAGVAFNVADLAMGLGVVLLVGGALAHAWLHRRELFRTV